MKITIDNYEYNGYRFDRLVIELPKHVKADEVFEAKIGEYLMGCFETYYKEFKEEESE